MRYFIFIALTLLLMSTNLSAQVLHFSATGCGPYAPEEEPLLAHHIDLVNRDGKSEFLVHLGDVVSGTKRNWPESQYTLVANILKKSKKPVFVLMGDNEWNDLVNPAEGLEFWNRNFRNFEQNFTDLPSVAKQEVRSENFSFVKNGVLIIGLNLVGGKVHDPQEWNTRHQQDADWVSQQFSKHASSVRAAVVLAQATPAASHELFFSQFSKVCREWVKPVLYLHADGHVWQVEKGWRVPNLWRVQTDQVKLNSPVRVSVTEDANDPFTFDRRLDLGKRHELFVDHFLIDRHQRTQLQLHPPIPQEVVIECNEAWEGNISAYFTILADRDRFRMYYRGAHFDEVAKKPTHDEFTCYAESLDGIHWVKPKLGLFEFQGSKENNIILVGAGTHNFTPMIDGNPNATADAKYKALAGGSNGLKAYRSPDGIRWTLLQDKEVITKGDFDSQNLAFWHPAQKRYVAYHRKSRDGFRDIMISVSSDFLKWNDPRFLAYGDAAREHLYTNAIQPYFRAPQLLIGFPTRFQPLHEQVEPVFMTSRDGIEFQRWSEPLISVSAPKDRDGNRSNYMVNGLVQLPISPDELSVYATEAYYVGPGSRVRRFTFRKDGFVSVHAKDERSEMITKSFTFEGATLSVNYRTVDKGSMRVEIQDGDGKPIPGYTLAESQTLSGDEIEHRVHWKSNAGSSVAELQNRPIRLRFEMQNADLFSMRFE